MANYSQTKYNWDGQYLTGLAGLSTGTIVPWSTSTAPTGFLKCDGSSISTTTYAALFAVIGYTYGGSGASFLLPDLQDKTAVGASAANSKTLAQSGGANTVTPTGNIGGSVAATTLTTNQIPSHSHSLTLQAGGCSGPTGFGNTGAASNSATTSSAGGGQSHTHNLSATFTGSASSVLQPYLVLIYIIKT